MKTLWSKFSLLSQYYLISLGNLVLTSSILTLLSVDFINIVFYMTAFVWHFALLTPGLRETVLLKNHKFSFLAVIIRANYYLQLFINLKKIPYSASIIRAISPSVFTFLLFVLGGSGNMLFTLLGSICFEIGYITTQNYVKNTNP